MELASKQNKKNDMVRAAFQLSSAVVSEGQLIGWNFWRSNLITWNTH
jgi:hypothetical protein